MQIREKEPTKRNPMAEIHFYADDGKELAFYRDNGESDKYGKVLYLHASRKNKSKYQADIKAIKELYPDIPQIELLFHT